MGKDFPSGEVEEYHLNRLVRHPQKSSNKRKMNTQGKHKKHKRDSSERMEGIRLYAYPNYNWYEAKPDVCRGARSSIECLPTDLDSDSYESLSCELEDTFLDFENFLKWTTKDIINWLRMLHLEKYSQPFIDEGVTGKNLARVDLPYFVVYLGIPVEQSRQIFWALKKLRSSYMNDYEQTFSGEGEGESVNCPGANFCYGVRNEIPVVQGEAEDYAYSVDEHEESSSFETVSSETCQVILPVGERSPTSTASTENGTIPFEWDRPLNGVNERYINSAQCNGFKQLINVRKMNNHLPNTSQTDQTTENSDTENYPGSAKGEMQIDPNWEEGTRTPNYSDVLMDRASYVVSLTTNEYSCSALGDFNEHFYNLPDSEETKCSADANIKQTRIRYNGGHKARKTSKTTISTSSSSTAPTVEKVTWSNGNRVSTSLKKKCKSDEKFGEYPSRISQNMMKGWPPKVSLSTNVHDRNIGNMDDLSESSFSDIEKWDNDNTTADFRVKALEGKNQRVYP